MNNFKEIADLLDTLAAVADETGMTFVDETLAKDARSLAREMRAVGRGERRGKPPTPEQARAARLKKLGVYTV